MKQGGIIDWLAKTQYCKYQWSGSSPGDSDTHQHDQTLDDCSASREDLQRPCKRPRLSGPDAVIASLRTPPLSSQGSATALAMARPGKRSRDNEASDHEDRPSDGGSDEDILVTPRPNRKCADLESLANTSTRSSRHSASSASRRSSPRKQMRTAERVSKGFLHEKLSQNRDKLSPSLLELLGKLEAFDSGVGLLPVATREELAHLHIPDYAYIAADRQPPLLSRLPGPNFVQRILNRAAECEIEREGECSWNMDVHAPLLAWVCRPDDIPGLVDFRCCTSATVHPEYQPRGFPSKMVDFYIVIRPPRGSIEDITIDTITDSMPGRSINHSDWGNFTRNPIAISFETKRSDEDTNKSILQMGTWHSCQWRSLRKLAHGSPERKLGFLPGVMVLGHEWSFVASVPGPAEQSILYTRQRMGTTETEVGIYKILGALQLLRDWTAKEYWPAFKTGILRLP
ncbi:uncharacterized protein CCOS01_16569 [Colletotrichum costaricense]|uniref:PD-(D/E)XK nuclease-like domain-containing protein n=1 Tax=Colletotrichum costaricense TaxID=1209916 RepID=A0AAI9YFK6_9PEZI|nr:uncharacterized protein CCOS01_16569 [Colletotrichum costaricense]KAK1506517.1 hypothetical protein CCOS01_16569 [Colletotrichum costaricense]